MMSFNHKITMGIPARIRSTKNEEGFNLIEILIALSILTIGLLAVAKMQGTALNGDSFASAVTESTTLAQDKLEGLLSLPYNDLVDGDETLPPHTITWTVTDDNPVPNSKLITVTVTRQYKGRTRTSQLISVKPQL
jgi:prepilin-type N-terminal cleavage/methylation domain-containing protein